MIQELHPATGLQIEVPMDEYMEQNAYYVEEEKVDDMDDMDNITALIMSVGVDLS
jgi:hypothetical protein